MPQRIVLITGASSGIGRATARALASAGWITYAGARRPEALAELQAAGLHALPLDVTNETSLDQAVRTIIAAHGAINLLINNAGYGEMGAIEEVPLARWRQQFETNVFGLVRLTQLVLPVMRAQGRGRIINISSGGGEFTTPLAGAYHASKYAVEAISDALRYEVQPWGIDVVVVQPGVVRTPLAQATLSALHPTPNSPYAPMMHGFERVSQRSAAQGRGTLAPEAVARVIVRAAHAPRPRTRYKIGPTAWLLPLLRHALPDRTWDGLLRRMFPPDDHRSDQIDAVAAASTGSNTHQ